MRAPTAPSAATAAATALTAFQSIVTASESISARMGAPNRTVAWASGPGVLPACFRDRGPARLAAP